MYQTFLSTLFLALGPALGATAGPASGPTPEPIRSPVEISATTELLDPSTTPKLNQPAPTDTSLVRWVLTPEGSEARYRVREQLAGLDFPNDAVGATQELTGTLVLDSEGGLISDGSEFRVQLASLTTDNERRDGYVRRRTLEVERFPEAVLIPRRFRDHPVPFPETGSVAFQLEADLTLHGQTQATVWEVTCEFGPDEIKGVATTAFPFDTFGIPVPTVARVLSVDDNIRLELDFRVVREER